MTNHSEIILSVIISCYNKERYIEETIQSLLNQTYHHFEIIIIDDKSSDESANKVALFATQDLRIKYVLNSENKGANFCRNQGIGLAKGKYLIFLDADDILLPFCLENRLGLASANPGLNLLVFTMGVFNKTLGDDKRKWVPKSKEPLRDFLLHDLPWSILQPLWQRQFLMDIGGFDEDFERLQDVELHTRALFNKGLNYRMFITSPDCYYRIAEERKNYSSFVFLNKFVCSSSKYVDKFYFAAENRGLKACLNGTIYQTFLQLLFQLKNKRITLKEFSILEEILFNNKIGSNLSAMEKFIFIFSKKYNLSSIRVPGINKLLKLLLLAN